MSPFSIRQVLNRFVGIVPTQAPANGADVPRPELFERLRGRPRPVGAPLAKGFTDSRHRAGVRRIVITVHEDMFARIAKRAEAEHVSFAEATRQLIERGERSGNGKHDGA